MAVRFELVTRMNAPREIVFDEARRVGVHADSMRRYGETTTSDPDATLGLGDEVTWRARHFGLRWTFTSRITQLDSPDSFVDEQVKGPFSFFRHDHQFSENGDATFTHDAVAFAAPYWPLGTLVERVVLARYMRRLIVERNAHLKRVVERLKDDGR